MKKNEETDVADDWSEDCLEYLYNNQIFFPGYVRSLKSQLKVYFVRNKTENNFIND